jgi:hypothetical protein
MGTYPRSERALTDCNFCAQVVAVEIEDYRFRNWVRLLRRQPFRYRPVTLHRPDDQARLPYTVKTS